MAGLCIATAPDIFLMHDALTNLASCSIRLINNISNLGCAYVLVKKKGVLVVLDWSFFPECKV